MTMGANGAPFWLILAIDLILTALVLIVGNRFGEYFVNYKDKISRISGAIFIIIGFKMFLLL